MPDEICVGKTYAVFNTKHNIWCRGIVRDKNEIGVITCTIFYVDYGTLEKAIVAETLKAMHSSFYELRGQALKCHLTSTLPEESREDWHPMASFQLENLCHDKWLSATITQSDEFSNYYGLSITINITDKNGKTKDQNVYDILKKFIVSDASKNASITPSPRSGRGRYV